jgi:hypothetical protein
MDGILLQVGVIILGGLVLWFVQGRFERTEQDVKSCVTLSQCSMQHSNLDKALAQIIRGQQETNQTLTNLSREIGEVKTAIDRG